MKAKLAPKSETDAPEAKKQKVETQSVDKNKNPNANKLSWAMN